MTPAISAVEVKETLPISQVTQLRDLAQNIQDKALFQTYAKMVPVQRSLGLEHLLKNRDFFESFKYSLAKAVAQTLGTNDRQVQTVYLFEPSVNPDAEAGEELPLEATVHLLVVVSKHSAALDAFIEALDQGLTRCLNQMPLPFLVESRSILNAVILTQEAVEQRQGYASLISSILAPPFKLWEREA
ncbi:MAG: hypothetical protein KDJ65_02110 [Anaerolineae bacterium]|nr:hypothetical protein [Anaerolineae bacterium]